MTLNESDVIRAFRQRGYLISREALDLVLERFSGMEELAQVLDAVSKAGDFLVVDKEVLERALQRRLRPERGVRAKNLYERPAIEPSIEGFKSLFRSRFRKLSKILRENPAIRGAIPIANALRLGGEVKVIGMVYSVNRGYLDLEDETGMARVYLPRSYKGVVVPDEVIGVIGRARGKGIYAEDVIKPGFERPPRPGIEEHFKIAMISDTHVGSKMFLEEEFDRFLDWLSASDVKYLLMNGDLVDGVGVYPGQEEDLEVEDVEEQYRILARKISRIPRRIKIFLIPGNHDMVRQAEPQPPLPEEICRMFGENVVCLSNPALLNLEGVKVLMYHGASLNDLVEAIPQASYQKFDEALRLMLYARHLAPIYGKKLPIAPEREDFLVIGEVPHILLTGHIHSVSVVRERGVFLVNASAWQSQTRYQRLMNFHPVPAKALVFDTASWDFEIVDFSGTR